MRRLFCTFLIMLCVYKTTFAATPIKSYMEIKDGRYIITKTFEAYPDEDPHQLKEKPFELDGFSYSHYETSKEAIPHIEKRQEVQTAQISTEDNKVQSILQQFAPDMDYEDDEGFSGKLFLEHASVTTEAEGYTTKTFTVKDTLTIMGLSSNDPAGLPKTTVKDGVTLNLQDVEWSAQETETVDFITVPTKYKAVANYSGSYTKQVPTGYISTVEYIGEVSKTSVDKIIYTLTYIGTEIPTAAPSPLPEPAPPQESENSFPWRIVGIAVCSAIILSALAAFFILFYNTFIYLKSGDEYRLIAKRHIKWNNPVVDLNGLDVYGKEVAVNVKKRVAERLFGRHIKTVADDGFSLRCLVDKQHNDFWYVIKVQKAEKHDLDEVFHEELAQSE